MPCPELVPGVDGAVDGGGGIHVVAVDDEGPAHVFHFRDGFQRHHVAEAVADLQSADVIGVHAIRRIGLSVHLPGASELVEIVHIQPAQVNLEGIENVVQRHAHGLALGAVDVDVQLWRVCQTRT